MTRRYETPAAFKQAVEHRLREEATGDGTELARQRQLFVFDRFLARAADIFGDQMILKGGLAVELRLDRARTTKDIDLWLPVGSDDLFARLQEAGRLDPGDFLRFEIVKDPHHHEITAEGMIYQGRRFRAHALLAGKIYGSPFGIDVVIAEPMTGTADEVTGSRFLAFAGLEPTSFRLYPVEVHIAEKVHAYTQPRARPNSRVKDLPDIALLATVRSFQASSLLQAIEKTFSWRNTHSIPEALPDPPSAWAPIYERIARIDGLRWQELEELVQAVAAFLDPVLAGTGGSWDPDAWSWTQVGHPHENITDISAP